MNQARTWPSPRKLPYREVGKRLGRGEDAARKRVNRVLEKIGASFRRRDVAVPAAVLSAGIAVRDEDPESAFHWTREIRDPVERHSTMRDVFRRWKESDVNDAERFLASDEATDAERALLK